MLLGFASGIMSASSSGVAVVTQGDAPKANLPGWSRKRLWSQSALAGCGGGQCHTLETAGIPQRNRLGTAHSSARLPRSWPHFNHAFKLALRLSRDAGTIGRGCGRVCLWCALRRFYYDVTPCRCARSVFWQAVPATWCFSGGGYWAGFPFSFDSRQAGLAGLRRIARKEDCWPGCTFSVVPSRSK